MRALFESLPILLAVLSIFYSARKVLITKCSKERKTFLLFILTAILLVLAQSSWAWSAVNNNTIGHLWADNVWTIFNSLVMYVHITLARKA